MSRRRVSRSDTYNHLNHPKTVSFLAQTPGWPRCPNVTGAKSPKGPCTPSGSEPSSCRSPSEQSHIPSPLKLPLRVCMGRPYNSKCVETSHLANRPRVAKKPTCHGSPHNLLCTDHPSGPASPTLLDQLIKGINYLDRSTNAFYTNCPQSLNLPRLAASYLERAVHSIHLDHPDRSFPLSYSHPSAGRAASEDTDTCIMQCSRGANTRQCVGDCLNTTCPRSLRSRNVAPILPQRPGRKLPELPLFGNGILSLSHLPKFWEAIRSGWSAPEPVANPCSWW